MSQSRMESLVECTINNLSGIAVGWITSIMVFPLFGVTISIGQNFWLTIIFTVVSMARSYFWRRLFTRLQSGVPNDAFTVTP